jgi:hypothetical protein
MMSILTSASPLCFLLLSLHIFLTFHLPSPCLLPSLSLTIPLSSSSDELLSKQLLLPMVESVSDYITSLLCHLPFESSSTSSTVHMNSTESDSRVDEDSMLLTGSSSSIRAVFYAIKGIYQTYFLSSKSADPGSLSLYRQCMDEIMLKVIAAYISIGKVYTMFSTCISDDNDEDDEDEYTNLCLSSLLRAAFYSYIPHFLSTISLLLPSSSHYTHSYYNHSFTHSPHK